MSEHPDPTPQVDRPFKRGDFGIDQDAAVTGKPLKEFLSVKDAWGASAALQIKGADGSWSDVARVTLPDAEWGGTWFTAPDDGSTHDTTYRYVIVPRDGAEVSTDETTVRHVNPAEYTGLQAEAYAIIKDIRPQTVIDLVDGQVTNTLGVTAGAMAHPGYDRIQLSRDFAEGGPAHADLKAVMLHEVAHLRQADVYMDTGTTALAELKPAFGPKLPLELSANCLMERWGGLAEGNHFDYCDTPEAEAATTALAEGRPWYAPGREPQHPA